MTASRNHRDGPRHRAPLEWRGQLSGWLLGLASGMGVNVLSNDVGYRGVAVAASAGGVLSAAAYLRRQPPRSLLVRWTSSALLGLAGLAAVAGVFGSSRWAGIATLTVAAITILAVAATPNTRAAGTLLLGTVGVGGGVAFIGTGVALLRHGDATGGMGEIGLGLAVIVLGVAMLRASRPMAAVAAIGGGFSLMAVGLSVLRDGELLAGVAIIGGGTALSALAFPFTRRSDVVGAVGVAAVIGAAVSGIGLGVAVLRSGQAFVGVAIISVGVAMIGIGTALLRDGQTRRGLALIGLAIAGSILGGAFIHSGDQLLGVVGIGLGLAAIALGVAELRGYRESLTHDLRRRARHAWHRAIADPDTDHGTVPPVRHEPPGDQPTGP